MKRSLITGLLAVCLVFSPVLFTACGSGSGPAEEPADEAVAEEAGSSDKSDSGALYVTEEGVEINKVEVNLVGSTYNFLAYFANNTDNEVEFDCTRFELKLGDGTVLGTHLSAHTFPANESYIQYAFPITDPGEMELGDKVSVYYDSVLLDTVEAEEF